MLWVRVSLWARTFHFVVCCFRRAPGRLTGPIHMKSSMAFIRGANQKVFFFHGAVQFDTCEAVHIFLTYLLMIHAYSNYSVFKSIDIKVPREPIVAESHLSVNAGNLDKHWSYPNFLHASYHFRNIVPHIHAHFCHKV